MPDSAHEPGTPRGVGAALSLVQGGGVPAPRSDDVADRVHERSAGSRVSDRSGVSHASDLHDDRGPRLPGGGAILRNNGLPDRATTGPAPDGETGAHHHRAGTGAVWKRPAI